jgi:hypothetical protein
MKVLRNLRNANYTVVNLKVEETTISEDENTIIRCGSYNVYSIDDFPFVAKTDDGIMMFATAYDPEEESYHAYVETGFNTTMKLDMSGGVFGIEIKNIASENDVDGDDTAFAKGDIKND